MTFDPHYWARRWRANELTEEQNDNEDDGWSADVHERCRNTTRVLLEELFEQLQRVPILPGDFTDRPELAAVLAAVHEATKPKEA